MKALITFQSKNKLDFEGSRLRKTIKGALELNNIGYTSLLEDEYDIVHIISESDFTNINEAISRHIPCVCSVLMCEGDNQASYLDYRFDDGKVTYTLKNKIVKLLNKVDHVIVPCKIGKQLLLNAGVTTPISELMPGVNLSRFDFNREDERQLFYRYYGQDQSKKLVISLGDEEYLEGVSSFIEAGEKNPDVLFYFFLTSGSIKSKKVKKLIKISPRNVHFVDMSNDDIYRSALINASIFMLPCYHQVGVITILEAMAAKCEIIMRSQPDLPLIIKDNETAHVAKFSETLTSLVGDVLLNRCKLTVNNAYEEAKKYRIELVGQKLSKIYQQVIINKNRSIKK